MVYGGARMGVRLVERGVDAVAGVVFERGWPLSVLELSVQGPQALAEHRNTRSVSRHAVRTWGEGRWWRFPGRGWSRRPHIGYKARIATSLAGSTARYPYCGIPHMQINEDGASVPSDDAVKAAVSEAVSGYRRVFGERLAQVWLFGSRATGTHRPDSDVDLLAVLHEECGRGADILKLCSVANPLRRAYGVHIDGHPTTLAELDTSNDDFHHFVRLEGHRLDE